MRILLFLMIAFVGQAQIDPELREHKWKVQKSKVIFGNHILRVEGENNYTTVTNLGYISLSQWLAEIDQKAKDEMWTEDRRQEEMERVAKFAQGGKLVLYVKRVTLESASFEYINVIIKNSAGEEILRKELKRSSPSLPGEDRLWSNMDFIVIPAEWKGSVDVFIIDEIGHTSKYHFKIVEPES